MLNVVEPADLYFSHPPRVFVVMPMLNSEELADENEADQNELAAREAACRNRRRVKALSLLADSGKLISRPGNRR